MVTGVVDAGVADDTDRDDDGDPETDPEGESAEDTWSEDSRVTADSGGSSPSRGCTSGPESEVGDFLGPESDDSAYEVLYGSVLLDRLPAPSNLCLTTSSSHSRARFPSKK